MVMYPSANLSHSAMVRSPSEDHMGNTMRGLGNPAATPGKTSSRGHTVGGRHDRRDEWFRLGVQTSCGVLVVSFGGNVVKH